MSTLAHEMRNHLAVAVANVEAFHDGVLEPTRERLGVVLDALEQVEALIAKIPRDGAGAPPAE